ncbi:MAG: S8 family serine peptidase [Candidatus Wallbacteria bacterium]|nr:S8 family serine peptidase [Candidatus Wallbacteria bacterium]
MTTGPGGPLGQRPFRAFGATLLVIAVAFACRAAWQTGPPPPASPGTAASRAVPPAAARQSPSLAWPPPVALAAPPSARPPLSVEDRLPDSRTQRVTVHAGGFRHAPSALLNDLDAPVVKLKSGIRELRPGAPVAVRAEREHLLVEFRGPLTLPDRLELERLDVRVLDFIPNRSFVLDVPRASLVPLWAMPSVVAIGNLFAEDRLSPLLLAGKLPDYSLTAAGRVRLRVSVFGGVSLDRARRVLERIGAVTLSERLSPTGTLDVEAPPESLAELAEADEVRYVEPASPPRRPASARAGSRSNTGAAGVSPLGVDGTGVKVGVWDAGAVDASHPDFGGRVTLQDTNVPDSHATHVGGIIAGSGLGSPAARGQAPGAQLYSFSFAGDPVQECRDAAVGPGVAIANHSWANTIGWQGSTNTGNQLLFGFYSGAAQDFDQMVAQTDLVVTKAAGDDRDDGTDSVNHDGVLVAGDYYETMEDQATAKNVLTVGATTADDRVASYSNWGPCDDGRIKPDLMAAGDRVLSTDLQGSYQVLSGTSMSAANVAGQMALFLDAHSRYGGVRPRASRVKAIALNSCADIVLPPHANTGPDYASGYGLLDVQQMLALAYTELHSPFVKQTLSGSFASTDQTTETTFSVEDARQEIRFTLAWTDPQGSLLAGPALVNDLDLRLIGPDGAVWMPWVMDPSNPSQPAVRGNNGVDNVEQVSVTRAAAVAAGETWSGTWRVKLRAGSINNGPQAWDLASTVALTQRPAAAAPTVTIVNPSATTSGRQRVTATATPASGRALVAVQYRTDAGPWLAMLKNASTGNYDSIVDYVVTTSAGALLAVRAIDDAVRETQATRALSHVFSDDHPNSATGLSAYDTIAADGAPGQGVLEPAGASPEAGDFFQVALNAGTKYQIEAAGADGATMELTLLSTDGTTVLARTTGAADVTGSSAFARILDASVGTSGTYFLKVRQAGFTAPAQPRYEYQLRAFTLSGFARFSASPTSGSPSFSVTFSNASFGPLSSYLWDFGDAATSTAISPTHTYVNPGTYTATMTANGTFASNRVLITGTGTPVDDHPSATGSTSSPKDDLIVDGAIVSGVIGSDGDVDTFRLSLAQKQNVIVDVMLGTLVDSRLDIVTPGGSTTSDDDPSPPYVVSSHLNYTASVSGTNTYFVKVYAPSPRTGSYFLRARNASSVSDLQITAVSVPASLPVSQVALCSVTVKNAGSIGVAAPFKVGIATTQDTSTINTLNFKIRREVLYTGGLGAGSSVTVKVPVVLAAPGSFFFWGVVNSDKAVPETDVNNNVFLATSSQTLTRRTRPPRVRTAPERSLAANTAVSLIATATDPDGNSPLTYSWRQVSPASLLPIANPLSPTASVTPTVAGRYRFAVTASDGQGGTATAPQEFWAFETAAAALQVQAVGSPNGTTFTQRQTSIPVSFAARNTGGHVAFVSRAYLKFRSAGADVSSGFTVRPQSVGASFLQTGIASSWSFLVDIGAAAASGSVAVDGVLEGTDAQTGFAISDEITPTNVTWTVRKAATLAAQTPAATSIGQGQSLVYTVPVLNGGDVAANGVATTLSFSGAGLTAVQRPGNPSTVAAGATGNFSYDITASSAAAIGPRTAAFAASGVDGSTGLAIASSNSSLAVVNVLGPPQLKLVSLVPSHLTMSSTQTAPATLTVQNAGGTSISFTAESLTLQGTSITAAGLTRTLLLPGNNATATFTFTLSAASTGTTTLASATFSATNPNTGNAAAISSGLASKPVVLVQAPPLLKIVAIRSELATVSQGQTFQATVTLRNDGGAGANITTARPVFENTGLTSPIVNLSRSLAGGGAQSDFAFAVTAATAGTTRITGATFAAADVNTGGALSLSGGTATTPTVNVLSAPLLKITSITRPQQVISVGQQILCGVTLRNEGQTSVNVTGGHLVASSAALSTTTLTTSVTLAGNNSTAGFAFVVTGASQSANVNLTTATFTARNGISNQLVGLAGNLATPPGIVVQAVPTLRIDSIQAGSSTTNSGQPVKIAVGVTNLGAQSVQFSGGSLVMTGSNLSVSPFNVSRTLAGGAATSFTFDCTAVGVGTTDVTSATFTAVDVNTNKQVSISANGATAASVTVNSPAGFKILGISAGRTTLSIGQSMQVTVTVQAAPLGVDLTQERLTISGGLTAPALNIVQSLAGNAQASYVFTATAQSAGTARITSASFDATNSGNGTPAPLAANQAPAISVTVQGPPILNIVSITAARASASVGQTFPVTVVLKNVGQASARITTATLNAAHLSIPKYSSPVTVPGGGATLAIAFQATATSSGTATISTATVQATDTGNGNSLPIVSNNATAATVQVQLAPVLVLSALATKATTVLQGSTFDLTATVTNTGEASILLSREELQVTNQRLVPPVLNIARTLPGGQSTSFVFATQAKSAGTASVTTALFTAIDANSGRSLPLAANNAAPLSLSVVAAPSLTLQSIVALRTLVTRGQIFQAIATLRNDGAADAHLTEETLLASNANLTPAGLTQATTVSKGGSAFFSFNVTAASTGTASLTTMTFTATNVTNGQPASLFENKAVTQTIRIQLPPVLQVVGLGASPAAISLGKAIACAVSVRNNGGATMRVTSASLQLSGPNLLPSPSSFSVDVAGAAQADVQVPATAVRTGTVDLIGATLAATDINTGLSVEIASPTAQPFHVVIREPAHVELLELATGRVTATIGQTFPITATFRNSGEDSATLLAASLLLPGLALTAPTMTLTRSLPRLDARTSYTFTARAASAGLVNLTTATVVAADPDAIFLPLAANRARPVGIEVQAAPSLQITTLSLSRTSAVTRAVLTTGQSVSVFVTIRHGGGAAVDLTGATLIFNATQLSLSPVTLTTGLPAAPSGPGQSLTIEFAGRVAGSGGTSIVTTALIAAADRNTGARARIGANLAAPLVLDLQPRGVPRLLEFTASRSTVTVGQHLVVTATVENAGGAGLEIRRVQLVTSGAAADVPVLVDRVQLDRNSSRAFGFDVVARGAGVFRATSAVVDTLDVNSGTVERLRANLATPVAVTMQGPPVLELVSVQSERWLVSRDDQLAVTVTIRNTGTAIARLTHARLSARSGLTSTGELSLAADLPSSASGANPASLSFRVTARSTGTEIFDGVDLDALDANTLLPLPRNLRVASPSRVLIRPPNRVPVAAIAGPGAAVLTDGRPAVGNYDAGASSDPDADPISIAWSVANGTGAAIASPASTATAVTFSATGHVTLRLRVTDARSGFAETTRGVTITANHSPLVDAGPDRTAAVGFPIRIAAAVSDPDGDTPTLRWYRTGGVAASLVVSGSSVSFTPQRSGSLGLALEASDGHGGISTGAVTVEVVPPRQWHISLLRGSNLISPPVVPLRADGQPFSCGDLLQAANASFLVQTVDLSGDREGFRTLLPETTPDSALEPRKGYLLVRRGDPEPLDLLGVPWPAALPTRHLLAGTHLLGLVVGVGSPTDSDDLRTILGSAFVLKIEGDRLGAGRFVSHVPLRSPAFPIVTGGGYLVTIPTTRDVTGSICAAFHAG